MNKANVFFNQNFESLLSFSNRSIKSIFLFLFIHTSIKFNMETNCHKNLENLKEKHSTTWDFQEVRKWRKFISVKSLALSCQRDSDTELDEAPRVLISELNVSPFCANQGFFIRLFYSMEYDVWIEMYCVIYAAISRAHLTFKVLYEEVELSVNSYQMHSMILSWRLLMKQKMKNFAKRKIDRRTHQHTR